MEFKGSSGNWKAVFIENNIRAIRNEGGIIMRFWKPCRYSGQHERYGSELKETQANQKLCLHDPELLKMLKELLEAGDKMFSNGEPSETYFQLLNQAQELIKEATNI